MGLGMMRRRMEDSRKMFAWCRIALLAISWIVLFSSVVYAHDCMDDISRLED